ncbi:staphylopine biosynthesis enzyme CntL [Staphylococcus edaphicus]|uniref:SAM-dependent methyltransferase n=1 Tax=Staphylococcus edaphicus TaxID=1955013 RepID=A0A2C6WPT9_9STAP|nr:staphylopine biosynthesis enzyme CntL [Staphylococcus edaphicus]PHK50153.1 SAM-dependent methyltransferase [Staphylococcus edaphicus]UQW82732.1 staphylopine biosynthesis enzyme CntL [Staphylococcus edaphicus]
MININEQLEIYLKAFEQRYTEVVQNNENIHKLEELIERYSGFVLDQQYQQAYTSWLDIKEKQRMTQQLADISAKSVKLMEELRAQRLLNGEASTSQYFENIEHCINEEFGQCKVRANDKLLLVGSGAYPMTLIQVAKEIGAEVIGIDIDDTAVDLGQRVAKTLAPEANIHISNKTVAQLEDIDTVTHIIFSSTVPIKYQILDQLYALTNNQVVISMRYGNGFKALFNYPMEETNLKKWKCVHKQLRANQIFDVAIYRKSLVKAGVRNDV